MNKNDKSLLSLTEEQILDMDAFCLYDWAVGLGCQLPQYAFMTKHDVRKQNIFMMDARRDAEYRNWEPSEAKV